MGAGSLAQGKVRTGRSRELSWRRVIAGRTWLAVVSLTALAAVLRFYRLGHQGYWFDEATTALLVHFSPGKMLGLIPQTESTPPLYYVLAWGWARLFGFGESGLRSLSACAGVLVVPMAYGVGARLCTRRIGLALAALAACSPLLIWYSQEARSYELLVLMSALSLLSFAYALDEPSTRSVAAWVVSCALALATHYYAVLVVVPEVVWLLFVHYGARGVRVGVGAVALCGLGLIPLAISQNSTGNSSWIGHASLGLRLRQIIPQSLIGTGIPAHQVLEPLAAVIAVAAIVAVMVRGEPRERSGALLAAGLAVAGLLLNLILIALGIDDLITRNLIALWLPAAAVVAAGLGARRVGVVGLLAAAVLCAIGVTAAAGVDFDRRLERPDWRLVARELGPRPQPGEPGRAILIQHYRTLLPLSLYEPGLRFLRTGSARVNQLDVISMRPPQQDLCWWGAACNLIPSQMQTRYRVAGFRPLWRRQVDQFTILRLVAGHPVALTPAAVSAALRTTQLRHDELVVQPPT